MLNSSIADCITIFIGDHWINLTCNELLVTNMLKQLLRWVRLGYVSLRFTNEKKCYYFHTRFIYVCFTREKLCLFLHGLFYVCCINSLL